MNNFCSRNRDDVREKKECSFCAKRGWKNRFHSENDCWNNVNSSNYGKRPLPERKLENNGVKDKNVRVANNSELESLFNEEEITKN